MHISHRGMEPKDVQECSELVANHPVIGRRYGKGIADLRAAWQQILSSDAKTARVFFADQGSRAPICFVGVSVFVDDDFVREIKRGSGVWVGPELAKRIAHGKSPLLSADQLRKANSQGGLNLIVWEGCVHPEFEREPELLRHVMSVFIEDHRGFLWKEIISSQMESPERLEWTVKSGALLWNSATGRYTKRLTRAPREIVRKPHIVGLTRTAELKTSKPWSHSWVGSLFKYHAPKCGFSRSEQVLLLSALDGGTDKELAKILGISLPAIKKKWLSIYRRVTTKLPALFPDSAEASHGNSERGKEKRRRLLAYLHEHPEELRPLTNFSAH